MAYGTYQAYQTSGGGQAHFGTSVAPVFGHTTYIAVTALIINLVMAAVLTLVFRKIGLQDGYDETRPSDYLADPVTVPAAAPSSPPDQPARPDEPGSPAESVVTDLLASLFAPAPPTAPEPISFPAPAKPPPAPELRPEPPPAVVLEPPPAPNLNAATVPPAFLSPTRITYTIVHRSHLDRAGCRRSRLLRQDENGVWLVWLGRRLSGSCIRTEHPACRQANADRTQERSPRT